jgi:hypothetical protein
VHEESPAAELTFPACIHRVHGNPIADAYLGDAGAKFNYFPRKLMPQHERYGTARPLMRSGRHIQRPIDVLIKVGMAQTGVPDAKQHFSRCHLGVRKILVPQVLCPVIDKCFHRRHSG